MSEIKSQAHVWMIFTYMKFVVQRSFLWTRLLNRYSLFKIKTTRRFNEVNLCFQWENQNQNEIDERKNKIWERKWKWYKKCRQKCDDIEILTILWFLTWWTFGNDDWKWFGFFFSFYFFLFFYRMFGRMTSISITAFTQRIIDEELIYLNMLHIHTIFYWVIVLWSLSK